jgi:hypothetical protein
MQSEAFARAKAPQLGSQKQKPRHSMGLLCCLLGSTETTWRRSGDPPIFVPGASRKLLVQMVKNSERYIARMPSSFNGALEEDGTSSIHG